MLEGEAFFGDALRTGEFQLAPAGTRHRDLGERWRDPARRPRRGAARRAAAMTRRFILVSRWTLGAPLEAVWDLLRAPGEWPQWWPYVHSVSRLRPGGEDDLGACRRFVWGSLLDNGLGLDITTTRVLRHRELEGRAKGDLDGIGTWQLAPWTCGTQVGYRWEVDLRKRRMRLAAPLLAPLFAWNHHGVMRAGARGMARRLGCRLEAYEALNAGRIACPVNSGASCQPCAQGQTSHNP